MIVNFHQFLLLKYILLNPVVFGYGVKCSNDLLSLPTSKALPYLLKVTFIKFGYFFAEYNYSIYNRLLLNIL